MRGINSRGTESLLVPEILGAVADQKLYMRQKPRSCARKATSQPVSSPSYQILQGKRAILTSARRSHARPPSVRHCSLF